MAKVGILKNNNYLSSENNYLSEFEIYPTVATVENNNIINNISKDIDNKNNTGFNYYLNILKTRKKKIEKKNNLKQNIFIIKN